MYGSGSSIKRQRESLHKKVYIGGVINRVYCYAKAPHAVLFVIEMTKRGRDVFEEGMQESPEEAASREMREMQAEQQLIDAADQQRVQNFDSEFWNKATEQIQREFAAAYAAVAEQSMHDAVPL